MVAVIFCPTCNTLVLAEPRCEHCGWERPAQRSTGVGALAWQTRLPAPLAAGLTLAADVAATVLALDGEGRLHALDAASGEPVWPRPLALGSWRVHERVSVAGDLVLVGPTDSAPIPAADKSVLALDLASGQERWRRPLAVRQVSTPAIAGDALFVATADGHGVCLNLTGGDVRWRRPIGGVFLAAPAVADGLVYFGSEKGVLTTLRTADGDPVWSFAAEAVNGWTQELRFTPAVADGLVYVTCWNRLCYALDGSSGDLIWTSEPTVKRPPMTSPVVTEHGVYFCAHDRYVYCLERKTGATAWRTQLPKMSQVAPALIEGKLYVASTGHKVYVLDPATGAVNERPLLETDGHVLTGWANDGSMLYLGDDEGSVYAVVVAERNDAPDPETLELRRQWVEAAATYALAGNLVRAAEIYHTQLNQPLQAAQLYERAGRLPEAAQWYETAGNLERARDVHGQLGDCLRVGEISRQMGDLQAAARAFEACELWDMAGQSYYELAKTEIGKLPQAAAMYEKAAEAAAAKGNAARAKECWNWAGDVYRLMNQPEKAVQLYKQADETGKAEAVIAAVEDVDLMLALKRLLLGSAGLALWLRLTGRHRQAAEEFVIARLPLEAAASYLQAGEFALAAKEFVTADRPLEAAEAYQRAGEFVLAAEQYQAGEKLMEAGDMMLRVPNYDAAGQLYRKAGAIRRAAETYLLANDNRAAAELFEKLEAWPEAATAWEGCQCWEEAAHVWERDSRWLQAAAAWAQAGSPQFAAECYWRAAEQAEREQNDDLEAAARLYDLAWQAFRDCGDTSRVEDSDQRRRHLRKQPWLEVELLKPQEFTVGLSDALDLQLVNVGWGVARDIDFEPGRSGNFEANLSASSEIGIKSLAPDAAPRHYRFHIIPRQAGKRVPMPLTIRYRDAKGNQMADFVRTFELKVNEPLGATPVTHEHHYHGPVVQGAQDSNIKMSGGDMISVERNGAIPVPGHSEPSMPPDIPHITCSHCDTRQPANAFKCNTCGTPFVHCPHCHLSQTQPSSFCEHCGRRY